MKPITIAVVLSATLVGCRASTPPPEAGGPPTELAAEPGALPSDLRPAPGRTGGTGNGGGGPGGSGAGTATPSPGGPGTSAPRPFRTVGTVSDGRGDAGLQAPKYADLLGIRIEDDGHSARVTVDVAADIPRPMPGTQQMAFGVDLFRRPALESDYQLYAQGTSEGWYAYLHTPQGIVEYPGKFALGGSRAVFTVPWSSLGNMNGTRFSGYIDWDEEQPVVNKASADRAPASGTASFSR